MYIRIREYSYSSSMIVSYTRYSYSYIGSLSTSLYRVHVHVIQRYRVLVVLCVQVVCADVLTLQKIPLAVHLYLKPQIETSGLSYPVCNVIPGVCVFFPFYLPAGYGLAYMTAVVYGHSPYLVLIESYNLRHVSYMRRLSY